MKQLTLVPDTSVIIEGIPSKLLASGELKATRILIPNAVLDELEYQANRGRETGYLGLEEVKRIREHCAAHKITFECSGPQPGQFEIDHAKDGAIDDMIRTLALKEAATLLTADRVQNLVAEAQGIPVHFIQFDIAIKTGTALDEFFTADTMSVHLKEDAQSVAKVGRPGHWEFKPLERTLSRSDVQAIAKSIVEQAGARKDSYIEVERRGSTIVQLGKFRTVITKPPFASAWEITAVRPVKQLSLSEYTLSEKLTNRLARKAEGVLIAGAPGSGKSTFVQALAAFYVGQQKIVKTVEAPRDLIVPKEVTQYSLSHARAEEIRDVLLLNRPDYTIFDEMRNTDHFMLYSDLRLSGVGMVGVVHATNPIDAIQRFLSRLEMGVIPHVVDTVIFIRDGGPQKVFSVGIEVKVPAGMTEADLARPVVCIYDFETDTLEYEVYTFGEQTIVIPVKAEQASSPALKLAAQSIKDYFYRFSDHVQVEMPSANKAIVFVPKEQISSIIGSGGKRIQEIEANLGVSIDVRELSERGGKKEAKRKQEETIFTQPPIQYEMTFNKKAISIDVSRQYAGRDIDVYDGSKYLLTLTANKKAQLKLGKDTPQGSMVMHAAKHGKLELRA